MVMGVAALNLILLRLAGKLWDIVTIQRDLGLMTHTIVIFLVIAVGQSVLAMVYRHLGIDPAMTFDDLTGRPRHILDHRTLIKELI